MRNDAAGRPEAPQRRVEVLEEALTHIRELKERVARLESQGAEPIAIVGIGCRFPGGADGPEGFWDFLRGGGDGIVRTSEERGGELAASDSPTAWAGLLKRVAEFDAAFFGISAHEAAEMDPQQRISLEVAWEAMEDGGQTLEALQSVKTGVYLGAYNGDYLLERLVTGGMVNVHTGPGNAHSIIANRISYAFDFSGPSMAIDTACSSSAVATHLACQSLRSGESDVALAGGVNLILSPLSTRITGKVLPLAKDGRCKTFDAAADGIVRGEGCGIVVLKRLSAAIDARDPIVAVIKGSAVNQDGRSSGLTAPNLLAQQRVIRAAIAAASVDPGRVTFIETHGTGTPLGDPIEIEALQSVYDRRGDSTGPPCGLGSVKANLGHGEAASGIAGVIKVALALRNGSIPPQLHLSRLNPHIRLHDSRFTIPTEELPWRSEDTRVAAVSSFGFGGTNAHLILEEWRISEERGQEVEAELPGAQRAPSLVLPLSARSAASLWALAKSVDEVIGERPAGSSRDICYSAGVRRSHHGHRLAAVGADEDGLRKQLVRKIRDGLVSEPRRDGAPPRPVFVFTGQGSEWSGMGRGLLAASAVFRSRVLMCDEWLQRRGEFSILNELTAGGGADAHPVSTKTTQFSLFAVQMGIVDMLRSWSIEPVAVVGHSSGEIVAAHVCGALSFEDAAEVLLRRSDVMSRAPVSGGMAAVQLNAAELRSAIAESGLDLHVAAVNAPTWTTVSGDRAELTKLLARLQVRGTSGRLLSVPHAFHSPHMTSFAEELTAGLADIEPGAESIRFFSTLAGSTQAGESLDGHHWAQHMVSPILFDAAIRSLAEDSYDTFVEVGPRPVLSTYLSEILTDRGVPSTVIPTLRRNGDPMTRLAGVVASLYEAGYPVDWSRYYTGGHCVKLPRYPWQRRRYWNLPGVRGTRPILPRDEALEGPLEPRTAADPVGTWNPSDWRTRVRASGGAAENHDTLRSYLKDRISRLLEGHGGVDIDPDEPLGILGLDSLMVVELRNQIERDLDVTVPLQALLGDPTLNDATAELALRITSGDSQVSWVDTNPPGGAGNGISAEEARTLLSSLNALSDERVESLLDEFGSFGGESGDV